MKQIGLFVIALIGAVACSTPEPTKVQEELSQYVEPRIGTAHCRWFHFTPGALPFGMAKPAPSTNGHLGNASGWEATGYDYRDMTIDGFPCLHEFQVGGIVLMPSKGTLQTIPGPVNDTTGIGYHARFDRAEEIATAGYYAVRLKDTRIQAELTATKRVAFQRFTFPAGDDNHPAQYIKITTCCSISGIDRERVVPCVMRLSA